MKKYLEYEDAKSSKFWEIILEGNSFTIRYGKIGANGSSKTKEFDTEEKAKKEFDKLVKQKIRKGYSEAKSPEDITKEVVKKEKSNLDGMTDLEKIEKVGKDYKLKFKKYTKKVWSEYKPGAYYHLEDNKVTKIVITSKKLQDILFIEEFKDLEILKLTSVKIYGVTSLANLKRLKKLNLSSNKISDISPLKDLVELTELRLNANRISDVSGLENLKNLETLIIPSNQISDISSLENLENLKILDIAFNKMKDASVLKNLKNLEFLDASYTKIKDYSFLTSLKKLKECSIKASKFKGDALKKVLNIIKMVEDDKFITKNEIELTSKEKKELVKLYKELESFDDEKIKATLEKLKENEKFYKMAEYRYLNMIKVVLSKDDATLNDMVGLLNLKTVTNTATHIFKQGIGYDYSETEGINTTNKIIAGITRNYINVDKFVDALKKTSSVEELRIYWLISYKLFDYFKEEAKFYSKGWFSKIVKKLSTLKMDKLMLDHSTDVYIGDDGMWVLMGASTVVKAVHLYIDVFQSDATITSGFWIMPVIPSINKCDATVEMDKSPLKFERYFDFVKHYDGMC